MSYVESGRAHAVYSFGNTYTQCYNDLTVSSNNTHTNITVKGAVRSGHQSGSYGFLAGQGVECQVGHGGGGGVGGSWSSATGRMNYGNWVAYKQNSYSFPRAHSAYSVQVWTKYWGNNLGGAASAIYQSGEVRQSFTVPAKASYTVSYNANGGSGAPGNQTKWYGENLVLSGSKPTRTGHNFLYWTTNFGSGNVRFNPGSTYTQNSGATLYANWQAHTYTVSYNANGGSGAPGNQTKTYGQTLKLSSTIPTRKNYNFKGWGTSAGATSVSYSAGANYTNNSGITLYAIWELAWLEPRVTSFHADRCDSAGNLNEEGTYAKVSFNWATDRGVRDIHINCNGQTYTNWVSGNPVVGQTSGSPTIVIGKGALSTENSYTVELVVVDEVGGVTLTTTLAPMKYIIDISPIGSVGFGIPANQEKQTLRTNIPVVNTSTYRGFHDLWGPSSVGYKVIAKSRYPNNAEASYDSVRITGTIGGWGASNNGYIDVVIPLRGCTPTTVTVNATTPAHFGSPASLLVVEDSSGYLYFMIWRLENSYGAYDLQFYGYGSGIEIINSDWTFPRISGTIIFDSNVVKTDTFGGYPAKLEKLNSYYGFALPDKTRTEWIRTTSNGIIPYQPGGASALGTSKWPFNKIYSKIVGYGDLPVDQAYINNLYWTGSGLKGRVMKQLWHGSAVVNTTISVPDIDYYNKILVRLYWDNGYDHVLTDTQRTLTDRYLWRGMNGFADGGSGWSNIRMVSLKQLSSTTLQMTGACSYTLANTSIYSYIGSNNGKVKITNIYGVI